MNARWMGLLGLLLAGCVGEPAPNHPGAKPHGGPMPELALIPTPNMQGIPKTSAGDLVVSHGCLECHSVEKTVVGPAFRAIAARYKNKQRRDYQLSVISVPSTEAIPTKLSSAIVLAQVGTYVQVRVFDADGQLVADKTEEFLAPGPALESLKSICGKQSQLEVASLTASERQRIVDDALTGTGLSLDIARTDLVKKIKHGGKGNWTPITKGVPMPPYSRRLTDGEVGLLVDWVLSL